MLQKVMHNLASQMNPDSMMIRIDVEGGLKAAIEQAEQKIIETMLLRCDQKHEAAAQKLGIARSTLWRKAKHGDN